MNADDRAFAIAARIADGSAIDWPDAAATPADDDPAMLEELRAIAALATLHRAPSDWDNGGAAPAVTTWGPLTLLGPIGEGRFGHVHRAWDSRLHRQVALKLLHAPASAASASPTCAIDEARLLARVRHPNVLTVYGAESLDGQTGIWTEYIEGQTLEARLADQGPMPPDVVCAIGIDLCRALGAVHAAGLLHRDIKAQNVMRETGGRIVLMDFGTGHDLDAVPARLGDLSGTPLYLAPEIFAGGSATVASDIYALGVLLFRLLTARFPVEGTTLDDVRQGHERGRIVRLREACEAAITPVPNSMIDALDRALDADPARRHDSAAVFEAALSDAVAGTPAGAPRQWSRRALLAAGAGVVITTGALAAAFDFRGRRGRAGSDGNPAGKNPISPPAGVAPSTSYRRLSPPASNWPGRPSRDGRHQPYVDATGNLWVWHIGTEQSHQVTFQPEGSREFAGGSAMSPNGDRVGYMWWTGQGKYELRVVSADGTQTPTTLLSPQDAHSVPIEWSADGTQILCWWEHIDGHADLALIRPDSPSGFDDRILQTFRRGHPRQVSLSPDGRFVVFDFPRDFRTMQSHVMIVETTGGSRPRVLIDEPANNLSPLWTPDGNGVFFTSNRSGQIEGWVVPVTNGVAQGEPVPVAKHLAGAMPLALTDDGAYHYLLDTSDLDVHTVSVDLTTRVPVPPGVPARVSETVVGGHVGPGWSPNGRLLAYVTRVPSSSLNLNMNRGLNRITILDRSEGTTRDVVPRLSALQTAAPRWSPDGRSVAVRGLSLENRLGYFQVDVATGETTTLLLIDSPNNESDYGAFQWWEDGRALLYRHAPRGLVSRNLSNGQESTVVDWKANGFGRAAFFGVAASPDGKSLAFGSATRQGQATIRAVYFQAANGAPRELFRVVPPERVVVQMWTPDNEDVLFTKYKAGEAASAVPHQLWRVPATGGEAVDTGIRIPGYTQPYFTALSPDGRTLAYTVGQVSAEQWVMEHFLPR